MNENQKFTLTELIGYVEHIKEWNDFPPLETILKELKLLEEQQ